MKRYIPVLCIVSCFALFLCLYPLNSNKVPDSPINDNTNNSKISINNESSVQEKPLQPREVFLTFDDGPCTNNTKKILDILKEHNVKATFFVVGKKGEENPTILKELSDSGMSIGIHTYSHEYKKIYKNLEGYLEDFYTCKNVIKNITGKEPLKYIRLPGGSDNLVTSKSVLESIKRNLNEKGFKYVDWNVCTGDAENNKITVDMLKKNVRVQCKSKKLAVVLMHDTYYKHFTVEALPDIIKYLKDEGFVFRTFDDLTLGEEKEMIRMRILNRS